MDVDKVLGVFLPFFGFRYTITQLGRCMELVNHLFPVLSGCVAELVYAYVSEAYGETRRSSSLLTPTHDRIGVRF